MYGLVIVVLLLLFLFIYSGAWTRLFGKGIMGVDDYIGGTNDFDKDGVSDFADKCPCVSGTIENDGCAVGYKITGTDAEQEKRECLDKKT